MLWVGEWAEDYLFHRFSDQKKVYSRSYSKGGTEPNLDDMILDFELVLQWNKTVGLRRE